MNACFHCRKDKEDHVEDKCLFEATSFREMTDEEVQDAAMVNLAGMGASFLKDMLSQSGFARQILPPRKIK